MVFASRQQRRSLNVTDVPEMHLLSRRAHQCDLINDESMAHWNSMAEVVSTADSVNLHDMFPGVDSALVESIRGDAPGVQQAVEVLLALCSSEDSVVGRNGGNEAKLGRDPSRDHVEFPALMDCDGWEVVPITSVPPRTGEAWSQRAKAVAASIEPKPRQALRIVGCPILPVGKPQDYCELQASEADTEYEARQLRGKQRAMNRVKYPRPRRSNTFGKFAEPVDVQVNDCDDPPGCAPAWRTFRLDNRL